MIHWLIQTTRAHPALAHGVPPDGLLSAPERERFEGLRTAKRRRDWLLGRWTAKHLLQEYLREHAGCTLPLDVLAVVAAADGAPEPVVAAISDLQAARCTLQSLSLSISHAGDTAFCALLDDPGAATGCDIERVEPRAAGFAQDYFTGPERAALDEAPAALYDTLVAATWSAKEAALKALRLGLTVDTRAVTCVPDAAPAEGWRPVTITADPALLGRAAPALCGWWRAQGDFVLTVARTGARASAPYLREMSGGARPRDDVRGACVAASD